MTKNKQNKGVFAQGQVINAVVTAKTGGTVSLREQSGFMFDLSQGDVRGEVGDMLSFEVVSNNKQGLTLRQLEHEQITNRFMRELSKQAEMADLKDLMEHNDFIERDIPSGDVKAMTDKALEKKNAEQRAVQKLRRQAAYVSDNAARAAVNALLAEGVNITKLDLGTIGNMLSAIRKDPNIDLDIPETRRNISMKEEISRKLETVKDISHECTLMFLKHNSETNENRGIEVDTLYTYALAGKGKPAEFEAAAVSLTEIEKLFLQEGIETSPENIETAEKFIETGVPVNKDTFDKYKFIQNIKNMDSDELMEKAVQTGSIYSGETTKPLDRADYSDLLRRVNVIKTEHIDLALVRNIPLTVRDLAFLAETAVPQDEIPAEPTPQAINSRFHLTEIALKLSYEAANSLYAKQIEIDVLTLTEAVDALRAYEREIYANRLAAVDAEVTEENINRVQETMDTARNLRNVPDTAFGEIITGRTLFTMRGVSNYIIENRLPDAETVSEQYQPFGASPRARYGDVLPEVSEQFAKLLENLEITASEVNIKAAKIAAANSIDINYENLLEIKVVDAKVSDVAGKLHPMIAANMVKDGFNALDRSIDDVLQYIEAFGDVYGNDNDSALAERIYELNRSKFLGSGEREIMMAIYKALHIIRKNDAPAIGAAVKANEPITLGRLLDLAESFKKPVDVSVKDGEGLKYRKTTGSILHNIMDKLGKPVDNNEYYGKKLVDEITEKVTPEVLNTEGLYDIDVEELIERIDDIQHIEQLQQTQQANIISANLTELENVPATLLNELLEAGVPLTPVNITHYRKVSTGRLFTDSPNDINNEELNDIIDDADLEKLSEKGYDEYISDVYEVIEGIAEEDFDNAERLNEMTQMLWLFYNTSKVSPRGYFMPVKLNGNIADVNMYITTDELDKKKCVSVALLLHSALGETRIRINLFGDEFTAEMTVNGRDEGYSEGLKQTLEGAAPLDDINKFKALEILPHHIKIAASAALKYVEQQERMK